MPFRRLIDSGVYTPEALAVIYEAFDLAWAELAPQHGDDPARIATAREELAYAVIAAADAQFGDAVALKTAAVEAVARARSSKG
ncbi:hypothetical protein [uncultured Hyphomicrobium sp.]|uniref:hypothetical protein n=1 Tax=uncultured Hyphomicrobium sp. TaxID=194373 RepID=UPI0025E2DEE3|nr:hypothetical protein [uncultured Hyphomicrobium sp.]